RRDSEAPGTIINYVWKARLFPLIHRLSTAWGRTAMATDRNTFVLVHGAWHGGWCWRRVADRLEAQGHKVFSPTLPGLGERNHLMRAGINVSTHVTDVVNLIKWEGLSGIVLCGHSYGGLVVSGAAEQAAAVIGSIVFLDAFVPENGDSM